jgi:ATP-dependent helicase HrpB
MRLPVHPRLACTIEEATKRGVGLAACMAAALLESGSRRTHCDLLEALDEPLDERTKQQLRSLVRLARPGTERRDDDAALCTAILLGFPDRVAKRRTVNQAMLANGVAVELASDWHGGEWFVALDVEDRTEKALPIVRLAARIEPEWLLDHFPERIRDENMLEWNRQAERVDAVSRLLYGGPDFAGLVMEESKHATPDPEQAATMLAQKALEAGIERFVKGEALEEWLARLEFAGKALPELAELFAEFCTGMRSFSELRTAGEGFLMWLEQRLGASRLREDAPDSIKLPSGRKARIRYERGKPPWVASQLQDFFGMMETPRIGPDRTPLVLHLLAPNRRPVQMTQDLSGFWDRLYPQVRRELMRRYPRHAWPERPNG